MNQYQGLPNISKEEAENKLKFVEGEELCLLLLSLSELDDWHWVQETYLKYVFNNDRWVAAAAITGLGHLARISGNLEKDKVIKNLKIVAMNNSNLEGKVQDTISDIKVFI